MVTDHEPNGSGSFWDRQKQYRKINPKGSYRDMIAAGYATKEEVQKMFQENSSYSTESGAESSPKSGNFILGMIIGGA